MKPTFCLEPNWSQEQLKILNSEPGIIVRGFAGSGKTLLAISIAIKRIIEHNERVLILVFTKTLARFIEDHINKFDLPYNKLVVLFHFKMEYTPVKFVKPDLIIVDEFQDFAREDLNEFLKVTRKIYFLGDDDQKHYETQYKSERKTIDQNYLIDNTGFPVLYITHNMRSQKGIRLLAQLFFYYNHRNDNVMDDLYNYYKGCLSELESCHEVNKFSDCSITFFKDEEEIEEIIWLYENVKNVREKSKTQTIAILVSSNERVKDLHEIFSAQKFAHSYKTGKELSDNFFKENTTILTYHSAKGLEFDHVFLPFSKKNINEKSVWQNAYFTALTRAVITLNISFSITADRNLEFRLQWLLDDYPDTIAFQTFEQNSF